jgi:CelD/BcsL family acetyltransferase involved in cellulose biosynthesis
MSWLFHPAREFARFASNWDLLAAASGEVPFLQSRFSAPLLTEFARGDELLAVFADAGGIEAMTLVCPRGRGVWQTYQPSQLPLGPWVMRGAADMDTLAGSLLRRLPGFAVALGLTQLDPLLFGRPADRGCIATLDYIQTAWVPVAGTFDAYWDSRGKNLRANMRKQRKKLQADGIAVRFEVLTRAEDVATAIASYGALESAGWKAALGTAIHPDNPQGRFYRRMLESFCAGGAGRVYRYWFGDRIVAVDLCIESRGTLVVLKTTYDESFKSLSPASLLREDELRAIFHEGSVRRIEFFGKVMDWHTQWTSEARTLYHMNCFRWTWMARLHALRSRPRSAPASAPGLPAAATPIEFSA